MMMQEIFSSVKIENFIMKIDIFDIFAQNIDCVYVLELPCRGGSNESPQSMLWIRNKKKNRYSPAKPQFFLIKVGFKGVYISWTCFPDVTAA